MKMDGSVVEKKAYYKMLGLAGTFGSLSKCSQLNSFL